MSECKYLLDVIVGFEGAFDHLKWTRVIETLLEVGCEEMSLWRCYFQERRACLVSVNEVVCRKVE